MHTITKQTLKKKYLQIKKKCLQTKKPRTKKPRQILTANSHGKNPRQIAEMKNQQCVHTLIALISTVVLVQLEVRSQHRASTIAF